MFGGKRALILQELCGDSGLEGEGWAGPGPRRQVLLTPWRPPGPRWVGGSLCRGLPDSTLLGGLAFPASQMPSATAAAGTPQGCSLILGSHADMLTHACTPPCLHAQALPGPSPSRLSFPAWGEVGASGKGNTTALTVGRDPRPLGSRLEGERRQARGSVFTSQGQHGP